jgi:UDP:flavonoid glycosyltransferase YjiC (YdhE family)
MARISLLMFQEPGHFIPTLRLSTLLQASGHTISYLAIPEFHELFKACGFHCHPILSNLIFSESRGDPFVVQNTARTFWRTIYEHSMQLRGIPVEARNLPTQFFQALFHEHPDLLPQLLLPDILKTEPDLLLCDAILGEWYGDVIARECHAPFVTLSAVLPHNGSSHRPISHPEIVLCPKELEIPGENSSVPNRHYCEPSIYHRQLAIGFPWHALPLGRPLVYCSLGTQSLCYEAAPRVLHAIIGAFSKMPSWQLVLVGGRLLDSELFDSLPPNVLLVPSAPEIDLLARSDLMINNGGLGAIKDAIMACVPMLVIPFRYDQPPSARRVEYHGLGRMCPPEDCSAEQIQYLVRQLAHDERTRMNLARMSALFRARESEAPAVRLLNRMLSGLESGCGPY